MVNLHKRYTRISNTITLNFEQIQDLEIACYKFVEQCYQSGEISKAIDFRKLENMIRDLRTTMEFAQRKNIELVASVQLVLGGSQ